MPNTSGIIQLAGFGGSPNELGGNSPQAGGVVDQSGVSEGNSSQAGGVVAPGGILEGNSPQAGGVVDQGGVSEGTSPQAGAFDVVSPGGIDQGNSPQGGGETDSGVGNMLGRPADGSERPSQGGLGVRKNGVAFSEREELDLTAAIPGLTLSESDDATPGDERAIVDFRVDAEVEVSRSTVDLDGASLGTTLLYTVPASVARLIVTRILLVALNVDTVTTQPEIDLRKLAQGDVLATFALGLTATDQAQEVAAAAIRLAVNTGEDLELGITVAGAATAYSVELIVFGRVVPA